MSLIVYTSASISLDLDANPLGTPGAEGSVHRIKSSLIHHNCCVKIYHRTKRTDLRRDKIEYMIKNRPQNLSNANFKICWPTEIVFDNKKKFVGFIMPMAFAGSEKLYEIATSKLSPKLLSHWEKFNRLTKDGIEKRLKVCVNITIAIHILHITRKYSIIDYKPQNILITNEGKVSLIDVDSFQISENNRVLFHAEVATAEYSPPESQRLNPSKSFVPETWDRFSLAVSFYEILFGIHPYVSTCGGQYEHITMIGEKITRGLFVHGSKRSYLTVIPKVHQNFHQLPTSIKNLFLNAFENGHTNPILRPTAEDWGRTINKELQISGGVRANIVSIPTSATHLRAPTVSTSHYQPASTYQQNPQNKTAYQVASKKDNYMVWKILCIALSVILFVLYLRSSAADNNAAILKSQISTLQNNNSALQGQIDSLGKQNAILSNNSHRSQDIENAFNMIAEKYPIIIKEIILNNVNHESIVITSGTNSFKSSEMLYLEPVLRYNSNLRASNTVRISYKIINPQGVLLNSLTSPEGFTSFTDIDVSGNIGNDYTATIRGFGSTNSSFWTSGKYTVEIWHDSIILGQTFFTITD